MKSTILLVFVVVFFALNCNATGPKKKVVKKDKAVMNALTSEEKAQGWLLLFDGKTNEGWRGYNKTTFPAAWTIEEGTLRLKGSGNGEAGAVDGGDLV